MLPAKPLALAAVLLVVTVAAAALYGGQQLLDSGDACDSIDGIDSARHRTGRPPRDLEEGRLRRLCTLEVRAKSGPIARGDFAFELIEAPRLQLPGLVDSNSPVFWDRGRLNVLNSAWGETYLSSGDQVENLDQPQLVQLPLLERPGWVWMEAVWRDTTTDVLYGWYHFEPADLTCLTAPIIGAAISRDGGVSWQDRGFVLESAYGLDCEYDNGYFVGGNGDFSVVIGPERRFLYFLYSNYAGPKSEQGIAVARSAIVDRGQPGTLTKYYEGAWQQPGLGGKTSALLPSSTGWSGPFVESFWGPSVHWNDYLGAYVALLNHTAGEYWQQEGVYISFSRDLLHWSTPEKILDSNDWYPQIIGLGEGDTDALGDEEVRLYVAGVSDYVIRFSNRTRASLGRGTTGGE